MWGDEDVVTDVSIGFAEFLLGRKIIDTTTRSYNCVFGLANTACM